MRLTALTPEKKLVFDEQVDEVTVPALKGELNILPGHSPLITTIETGLLRWKAKGSTTESVALISSGYCQVTAEGVNVLAESADFPQDIVKADYQKFLAETEPKLLTETLDDEHFESAQREVKRLRIGIDVAKN